MSLTKELRLTAAGFEAHLLKPVDFLKLEVTIAELLSRAEPPISTR